MIKVYVRKNEVQDGNGTTLTQDAAAVQAALSGQVNDTLLTAMRGVGLRPALGEEVTIDIGD